MLESLFFKLFTFQITAPPLNEQKRTLMKKLLEKLQSQTEPIAKTSTDSSGGLRGSLAGGGNSQVSLVMKLQSIPLLG